MNITEKYRGGNAIPDLEVIDFWKESLKDLTDVILTDHYSFPNNGKLFTDKFDEYIKDISSFFFPKDVNLGVLKYTRDDVIGGCE